MLYILPQSLGSKSPIVVMWDLEKYFYILQKGLHLENVRAHWLNDM